MGFSFAFGFLILAFNKSKFIRLNPNSNKSWKITIKMEQIKNVKIIPSEDNKIFSSINPNIIVGKQIKVVQIKNFKYFGFSTQHLFIKIKFNIVVNP